MKTDKHVELERESSLSELVVTCVADALRQAQRQTVGSVKCQDHIVRAGTNYKFNKPIIVNTEAAKDGGWEGS